MFSELSEGKHMYADRSRSRFTTMAASAFALSIVAAVTPAAAASKTVVATEGELRDYNTAVAGPFDDAEAEARIVHHGSGSTVTLRVDSIDRSAARRTFGAHLHFGECVTDLGAAAKGHYNTDAVAGRTPARVNARTEVWLDFVVTRSGKAKATARVPFVPTGGARSIVVHELSTQTDGTAGGRLACLPVVW